MSDAAGDDGATVEDFLEARVGMAVATIMLAQNMIYGEPLSATQRGESALVMWLASDPLRPRVAMWSLQSPRVMRTAGTF